MSKVAIDLEGKDNASRAFQNATDRLVALRAEIDNLRSRKVDLTVADTNKLNKFISEANRLDRTLNGVSSASKGAANELGQLTSRFGGLGSALGGTSGVMSSLFSAAGIGALSLGAVAVGAAKVALELGTLGAQAITTERSFQSVLASVNVAPSLLNEMSDAAGGTIEQLRLMQLANTALAGASVQLGQAFATAIPKLIEGARAANQLNPALGDTEFLFQSLVNGIKRGSPMLIDNTGITLKLGEANQKYADSIGKTVEQLTEEEKKFALLNATMEGADRLVQQAGGNLDNLTTSAQTLTAAWKDLRAEVGKGLATETSGVKSALTDLLNQITTNIQAGSGDTTTQLIGLEKQIESTRAAYTAMLQAGYGNDASQIVMLSEMRQILSDLIDRFNYLSSTNVQWGDAGVAAALRQIQAQTQLDGAIGDTTDGTKSLAAALDSLKEKDEAARVNTVAMAIFRGEISLATAEALGLAGALALLNAPKIGTDIKLTGVGLDPSGVGQGVDRGAERIRAQQVVDETLEGYRLRQEEAARLAGINVRAADATQRAWESAFNAIANAAEAEFSSAQDQLKGLLPELDLGGLGANAPGTNGPFEDIFRAADVAKLGGASPWAAQIAAQLGVSGEEVQAQAKAAVEAFAQGFRTPEVRKLIDEAMLVDQVKQAEAAKASLDSWGKEIAKQAGVNPSLKSGGAAVFDSAFGADKKTGKNDAAEAAAQNASTLMVDALGSKLKDEAGRAIGFGQTLWGKFEEGIVDQAKSSGALRAAIDAMVAAALAGKTGGPPPPGNGVSGAGKSNGVAL